MDNVKNNRRRAPRQHARRKPASGCEPSSLKLSSQLFRLFPVNLDKVMSVTDGDTTRTFTYHADGQLATASYGRADANRGTVGRGDPTAPQSETFQWDGLALIQRGDEQFINEPHVGNAPKKLCFGGKPRATRSARRARKGPRGNPVATSKGTSYFNDALGTTVGSWEGRASSRPGSGLKYSAAALTAFGESLETLQGEVTSNIKHQTSNSQNFFTGKPYVEGLGHAFWMRNYRACRRQSASAACRAEDYGSLSLCDAVAGTKPGPPGAAVTAMRPSRRGCSIFGILCANKES